MLSEAVPYAFGDIVLAHFPFTDQTAVKRRPAVVVSSRAYNVAKPDLMLMPVTSQLRPATALGDIWLADWKAAGLLKPSAIKPVIAITLGLRRLGAVSAAAQDAVRSGLGRMLG